jgi:hypothetical protein
VGEIIFGNKESEVSWKSSYIDVPYIQTPVLTTKCLYPFRSMTNVLNHNWTSAKLCRANTILGYGSAFPTYIVTSLVCKSYKRLFLSFTSMRDLSRWNQFLLGEFSSRGHKDKIRGRGIVWKAFSQLSVDKLNTVTVKIQTLQVIVLYVLRNFSLHKWWTA